MTDFYNNFFANKLNILKNDGRYRTFTRIERIAGQYPFANYWPNGDGEARRISVWCSNDYLGMGQNKNVIQTMQGNLANMGTGAGGTRNISGNHNPIVQLENILAQWHQKPAGLVFTSGYVANMTAIATLVHGLQAHVFSDSLNHNSIIMGINAGMAKNAGKKFVFPHNNLDILRSQLAEVPIDDPKIIIFESLYSMDGAMGDIIGISQLAREFGAISFCDEVHAIGLYGDNGAGLVAQLAMQGHIDIIQGTLGKAVGQIGGYITGSAECVDYIRSNGAGFIFTTALPPHICAGAIEAINLLQKMGPERATIQANAERIRQFLRKNAIAFIDGQSHIVPIMIGNAKKCKIISDILLNEFGYFVQPINYPTVPVGTERLRVTTTPFHTPTMIDAFCENLLAVLQRVG